MKSLFWNAVEASSLQALAVLLIGLSCPPVRCFLQTPGGLCAEPQQLHCSPDITAMLMCTQGACHWEQVGIKIAALPMSARPLAGKHRGERAS